MSYKKRLMCMSAACVVSFALAPSCLAGLQVVDFSGGASWRSTDDSVLGNRWAHGIFDASDGVAAYAPYSNSGTTALNSNRMMWYCGTGGDACRSQTGEITGASGPTEVFFGYSFYVKPGASIRGARAAIIGDDFFTLVVNSQRVTSAVLDEHKRPDGQPDPLIVDLAAYLHEGWNVLAIRAMDGYLKGPEECGGGYITAPTAMGAFCKGDRGNEYMFVSGSAMVVPEPASISLAAIGLLGVGLLRRRPPTA